MTFTRLITFLTFLLYSMLSIASTVNKPLSANYVIVGVGTAGAVLAKKLSDDHSTFVIALHNGKNLNSDPLIKLSDNAIFTVADSLVGPPLYQKAFGVPQVNANNRLIAWVEGVPLGGNSAINAGAYCRGTNQVYAQWEAIAGPLWSVHRILNVYKELESYVGLTTDPSARGFFGPLVVRQIPIPSPVARKFTQALMLATGLPFVLDYNDPNTPTGISSQLQYTQIGSEGQFRESSGIPFLNTNIMTPKGVGVNGRKLRVLFNSTALKIIWSGNRAVGVEFIQDGKLKTVYANKGIIVTAGLLSSTFLMNSGVGPKATLQSLGIPVIFDNPNVGQGLADQFILPTLFASNPLDTTSSLIMDSTTLQQSVQAFGPLSNTLLGQMISSMPLRQKSSSIQSSTDHGLFTQISWLPTPGGDPSVRTLRFSTVNPIPGITVGLFDLIQPQSRGSITLNSANPLALPRIDFGIFSNPNDLNLYVLGFKTYIKALAQTLQAIDPLYQLIFPDPAIIDNDALLIDFIKEGVLSSMHFQSHCRMAPMDQGGVVDSTGHVYGVHNLIVADNSIVPVGMDGSPMATAYLIAANIADILVHPQ